MSYTLEIYRFQKEYTSSKPSFWASSRSFWECHNYPVIVGNSQQFAEATVVAALLVVVPSFPVDRFFKGPRDIKATHKRFRCNGQMIPVPQLVGFSKKKQLKEELLMN